MAIIERKKGGRPRTRPSAEVLANLYSEHTAKEIANQYGVTEATVRSWIARARKEGR